MLGQSQRLYGVGLWCLCMVIIGACSPQTAIWPDEIKNIEELDNILKNPDVRICTQNISNIRDLLATPAGQAYLDYSELEKTFPLDGDVISHFLSIYRRASLWRRANVDDLSPAVSLKLYEDLMPATVPENNIEGHHAAMDHWDNMLKDQRSRDDNDSDEYHLRFCVINDQGGRARAAARHYLLENVETDKLTEDSEFYELIKRQWIWSGPFHRHLLNKFAGMTDNAASAKILLLRNIDMAIVESDPRDAKRFWEKRDEEIEKVLAYIDSYPYKNNGTKLADMVSIDQSLRGIYRRHDSS